MPQLGQYYAFVTINGVAQPEYAPEYCPQGSSASCWIALEAEKSFSVNWSCITRDIPLEGVVVIDGVECNRHIMLDTSRSPNTPNGVSVSFAGTTRATPGGLVFSPITTADDENHPRTSGDTVFIGTIKLELWRIQVLNISPAVQTPTPPPVPPNQVVHERSKEAGGHHVELDEERPYPLPGAVYSQRMFHTPYASFIFRYKPVELSIVNDIIPQPWRGPENDTAASIQPSDPLERGSPSHDTIHTMGGRLVSSPGSGSSRRVPRGIQANDKNTSAESGIQALEARIQALRSRVETYLSTSRGPSPPKRIKAGSEELPGAPRV